MDYYVYVHKRLKDGSTFYVGKGKGLRFNSEKSRNSHWNSIVKKDGGFQVEIISEGLTNDEACILEINLITEIGIENLSNMTFGGEGGNTRVGFSQEKLDKWSLNRQKALKGRVSPMKGLIRKDHSEKIKKLHQSGLYSYEHLQQPKSNEHKQNLSEAALKRVRTEVKCPKCGRMILDTHLKPHMRGTKCK